MAWRELDDLVTRVVQTRSEIAALQADEAALLCDAADLVIARIAERRAEGRSVGNDLPLREVSSELGAAMRLSDRTVQARMGDATTLITAFEATYEAFRAGRIHAQHVSAMIDCGAAIESPAARAEYERIVLEAALHETPTRLRSIARVVAARVDPGGLEEQQLRARSLRRIRVADLGDSMARLTADMPAVLAWAIHDRLTQMAHELDGEVSPAAGSASDRTAGANGAARPGTDALVTSAGRRTAACSGTAGAEEDDGTTAGAFADAADDGDGDDLAADPRTMDERRADILADILLTGAPTSHGDGDALGAITAHVQITVPVLTAAGVDDEPALLAGYGPIDRETAQILAAGAPGWDRVMFHPTTGTPLGVDRYRPSAELRRFLRARDERCRFPGCVQPPWRCDIDHTIDAATGGATDHGNLAHFCRRHHTVKHATAWRVRQLRGGSLEWTSITGRTYLDRPVATVQFVPSGGVRAGESPPPF